MVRGGEARREDGFSECAVSARIGKREARKENGHFQVFEFRVCACVRVHEIIKNGGMCIAFCVGVFSYSIPPELPCSHVKVSSVLHEVH